MAMTQDKIEIYRSRRNNEYGWRYITKNGARVAVAGETYKNHKHAIKMVDLLFRHALNFRRAVIVDLTTKSGKR